MPIAFVYAHEIAHKHPKIYDAGVRLLLSRDVPDSQVATYKAFRDARISSPDDADVQSEMIADLFGAYMSYVIGDPLDHDFGLERGTKEKFFAAFAAVQDAAAIEYASNTESVIRPKGGMEHSRIGFNKPDMDPDSLWYMCRLLGIDYKQGQSVEKAGLSLYNERKKAVEKDKNKPDSEKRKILDELLTLQKRLVNMY